ncbi:MAG: hypothetical protein ABS955_08200 [Stenotrophomonas maltophilia]
MIATLLGSQRKCRHPFFHCPERREDVTRKAMQSALDTFKQQRL